MQQWLWDDDVDETICESIEQLTGEELVDEDYDSAVDGVVIWWRDGDDEDELADTIMDATNMLDDDAPMWVLTPKPGREGSPSSSTVQSAAKTAEYPQSLPDHCNDPEFRPQYDQKCYESSALPADRLPCPSP